MDKIESFCLDEGVNIHGVRKQVTFEGDQAVTKLTYDAEPMLNEAHNARVQTAGQQWGEMRRVGVIPLTVLNHINATVQGSLERSAEVMLWLQRNPKMVTFDKFLK